jgi:hypothetical protein
MTSIGTLDRTAASPSGVTTIPRLPTRARNSTAISPCVVVAHSVRSASVAGSWIAPEAYARSTWDSASVRGWATSMIENYSAKAGSATRFVMGKNRIGIGETMSNEPKPKTSGKTLVSLMGPKDLDTPEKRKAYASGLADDVVKAVQALRKSKGLPPLPKVAPKEKD